MITANDVEKIDIREVVTKLFKCCQFFYENNPDWIANRFKNPSFIRNGILYEVEFLSNNSPDELDVLIIYVRTSEDYRIRILFAYEDNDVVTVDEFAKGAWVLSFEELVNTQVQKMSELQDMIDETDALVGDQFWI